MSIYQNAINSIQIGVEDYTANNPERNISAIRNIIAGILLLYKEKLLRLSPAEHPELLIKQNTNRISEAGNVSFIASTRINNKTVNIGTIKDRFGDFDVKVEWDRFDSAVTLRNDIEHYYTKEPQGVIKEIIASSFVLINDFVTHELEEDPRVIFGRDTWQILLDANEVFLAEKKVCLDSLAQADWEYDMVNDNLTHIRCEKCSSSLVLLDENKIDDANYPDIPLKCRQCQHEFEFSSIIEEFVSKALYYEFYTAIKDGGEPPTDTCVSCGMDTYIIEEGCCINCKYEIEYMECTVCHTPLSLQEQINDGLCDYHQNRYETVMTE